MFKAQECVEPEFESKGRPSGGESVSNVSASSLESATTTYNRGSKGPRAGSHKVKESQNIVFNRSGVYSLTGPSKVVPTVSEVRSQAAAGQRQALLNPADGEQPGRVKAQEQQGQAEAHAMSKSSG